MSDAVICDICNEMKKEGDRGGMYAVNFRPMDNQRKWDDCDVCPDCMPETVVDAL